MLYGKILTEYENQEKLTVQIILYTVGTTSFIPQTKKCLLRMDNKQ